MTNICELYTILSIPRASLFGNIFPDAREISYLSWSNAPFGPGLEGQRTARYHWKWLTERLPSDYRLCVASDRAIKADKDMTDLSVAASNECKQD